MKLCTAIVVATAALATLSGCVVAPGRGEYRDHDRYDHRYYDHRYQDRDINVHSGERRSQEGDHAGGTGTPD